MKHSPVFVDLNLKILLLFRYYEDESKRRDVILNVISLEFSCSKLAPIVEGPKVIREVSVDCRGEIAFENRLRNKNCRLGVSALEPRVWLLGGPHMIQGIFRGRGEGVGFQRRAGAI